jgi:hypothetical protein
MQKITIESFLKNIVVLSYDVILNKNDRIFLEGQVILHPLKLAAAGLCGHI